MLLETASKRQWERITPVRRAGVATPLFSLYSQDSTGVGEFEDLKQLGRWCRKTGLGIIQLLPMNDVGLDFRPYDAQSSFALDPMYLRLADLKNANVGPFRKSIKELKRRFPCGKSRVDYGIKEAKMEVLWRVFQKNPAAKSKKFAAFVQKNAYWLEDYALFKTLKEEHGEKGWQDWAPALRNRNTHDLLEFKKARSGRVRFHQWLQWQAFEQFADVKTRLVRDNVLVMGDLPFLVSRDSADVWSHQDHFKLDFSAGAPPDLLFSKGQRWGMPPFNWKVMERDNHRYLVEKLAYAQNFYDLFRLDHAVGLFRVWTIPVSESAESGGARGAFDPPDENIWEEHGRKLLSLMLEKSLLLPCAEDLGTVPDCSYKVLAELGIPGMEIQRWMRDWKGNGDFKAPETYRSVSITSLSTHDIAPFTGWWLFEAGTTDEHTFRTRCEQKGFHFEEFKARFFDPERSRHGRLRWKKDARDVPPEISDFYRDSYDEKERFWRFLGLHGPAEDAPSPRLVRKALEAANRAASVFSVQLLQDWLAIDPKIEIDPWESRINFPGTMSERNWSVVLPISLETLNALSINDTIRQINEQAGRIPVRGEAVEPQSDRPSTSSVRTGK